MVKLGKTVQDGLEKKMEQGDTKIAILVQGVRKILILVQGEGGTEMSSPSTFL